MVNPPRSLTGAFNRFYLDSDIDATPTAILNEIYAGIKRVCKFYTKQKNVVYPSPQELRWVESALTNAYINWIQSSVDIAHANQCLLVDGTVFYVQNYRGGMYTLLSDKLTMVVSVEQYQRLCEEADEEALKNARARVTEQLAFAVVDNLWRQAGQFPYFNFWSSKLNIKANIMEGLNFSVKKRLKNYRLAVQVTTSPEIMAAVNHLIASKLPNVELPRNPTNIGQIIDALRGPTTQSLPQTPESPKEANTKPKASAQPKGRNSKPETKPSEVTSKEAPQKQNVTLPELPTFDADWAYWEPLSIGYLSKCSLITPSSEAIKLSCTILEHLFQSLEDIGIPLTDDDWSPVANLQKGELPEGYEGLAKPLDWYDMIEVMEKVIGEFTEGWSIVIPRE